MTPSQEGKKMAYPSHAEMCEMFDLAVSSPAPEWTPYAVQLTVIEVFVNGHRLSIFGGAMQCGACGFGISMRPDAYTTPPKREDNACPKCATRSGEEQ